LIFTNPASDPPRITPDHVTIVPPNVWTRKWPDRDELVEVAIYKRKSASLRQTLPPDRR
jgi:hypothetical protein